MIKTTVKWSLFKEFMLIPGLTITENIKLNREITSKNFLSKFIGQKMNSLDYKSMNSDARNALNRLNLNIKETTKISELPVGSMQFTEIAREIDKRGIKLLSIGARHECNKFHHQQ